MVGIIVSIVLFILSLSLKTVMLAAKISIKTATTASKIAYNGVKRGSKALQKAGIGNDEVGKVLRGGEKVAHTTAKAGRAVANTGKAAVNAGKATVKGVKTGIKVTKKLGQLGIKAVQLLIKFIQGVIALIKIVIATIAASEVLLIIVIVILVAGLVAAAGFVAVYVINNGEFTSSGGSSSGGIQSEQSSGGSNATWTEAYTTMFDWYVDNMPFELNGYSSDLLLGCRYSTSKYVACDLIDGKNVGCFCSGYVQASLQYSGIVTSDDGLFDMNSTGDVCGYLQAYIDSSGSTSGSKKIDSVLEKFDLYTYSDYTNGKYKPEAGDIVIRNGHMEIYGGLKDGKATKFTWGESYFREDGKHCSSQDCSSRYLKKGEPGITGKSEADYVKKYSYFLKLKAGASSSQTTTEEASTTEESTTEATTASE